MKLAVPTPLEYFASLVHSDDGFPLLEAAASIAQDEYPQLDIQQVQSEVDHLVARLQRRLAQDAPALQRLAGEAAALVDAWSDGRAQALAAEGLEPVQLGAKDGLCLVNGTPCMTGSARSARSVSGPLMPGITISVNMSETAGLASSFSSASSPLEA